MVEERHGKTSTVTALRNPNGIADPDQIPENPKEVVIDSSILLPKCEVFFLARLVLFQALGI